MINIKINVNNMPSNINVHAIAQEISEAVEQFTGQNTNININVRDDNSISPK